MKNKELGKTLVDLQWEMDTRAAWYGHEYGFHYLEKHYRIIRSRMKELGLDTQPLDNAYETAMKACDWMAENDLLMTGAGKFVKELDEKFITELEKAAHFLIGKLGLTLLMEDGDVLYSMTLVGSYMEYCFINTSGKDYGFDITGCLEETLHRMLAAGWDDFEIAFFTGMTREDNPISIDLGYTLPDILSIRATTRTDQKIFIINGKGGSGKDALIKTLPPEDVINYSSIDTVKKAAKILGWNGKKDENGRLFLSSLKQLTKKHTDLLDKELMAVINSFRESEAQYLFLHIREPEEIARVKGNYPEVKTLLVKSPWQKDSYGNTSDDEVDDYLYDAVFVNEPGIDSSGERFLSLLKSC